MLISLTKNSAYNFWAKTPQTSYSGRSIYCLKMRVQSKKLVHTSKVSNICFMKGLILFQYFQILLCLCCFCCKKKNADDLKPVKMKSKKSSPYPDDGYPVENLIVTQIPTNSNGGGSSGQPPNYQSIRHSIYIRTVSSYSLY